MRLALGLALAIALGACGGEEDAGAPPPPPPGGGGPAKKAAAKDKGGGLAPRMHVEERVYCPPPEKPTGPACDKEAPACDPGKFCLQVGNAWTCEACPERDSIRHEFKDRDFVVDQTRDPFHPFLFTMKGLEEQTEKKEEGPCKRQDQFVAPNYSYLDLTLVGIVAQGTQRKVLMMDRGNLGHIVHRGDCVGKEKAVVKDIGPGFVTFVIAGDDDPKSPNAAPTERSVQLHPTGLTVTPEDMSLDNNPASSAPVVAPSSRPSPPAQQAPAPPAPAPAPQSSAPIVKP